MRLVNLTFHDPLRVWVGEEVVASLPGTVSPARCTEVIRDTGSLLQSDGLAVPLAEIAYGHVEGLPPAAPDTVYVVSQLVANAVPHRTDLYFPIDLVRDTKGDIIGCRRLARPSGS